MPSTNLGFHSPKSSFVPRNKRRNNSEHILFQQHTTHSFFQNNPTQNPSRSYNHWGRYPWIQSRGLWNPLHPQRCRDGHVPRQCSYLHNHADWPLEKRRVPQLYTKTSGTILTQRINENAHTYRLVYYSQLPTSSNPRGNFNPRFTQKALTPNFSWFWRLTCSALWGLEPSEFGPISAQARAVCPWFARP